MKRLKTQLREAMTNVVAPELCEGCRKKLLDWVEVQLGDRRKLRGDRARWALAVRWAKEQGGSAPDIARKLGVTAGAVRWQMAKRGVVLQSKSNTDPDLWDLFTNSP